MGPENRPRFLQLLLLCPREIGEPFVVEGGGDRVLPLEHCVDEVLAVRAVCLLRFRPCFTRTFNLYNQLGESQECKG